MAAFSSSVNSTSSRTKSFGALDFGLNQLKIFTVFSVVSRSLVHSVIINRHFHYEWDREAERVILSGHS